MTFKRNVSDWSYYQDLRRVAEELGHAPTTKEYRERGRYSPRLGYTRAGGWFEALERAGLDPDDREPLSQHRTPNLPVNPEREYCGRCGSAGKPLTVDAGGRELALCGDCLDTLRLRGVSVEVAR